jgi:hypothetical protein
MLCALFSARISTVTRRTDGAAGHCIAKKRSSFVFASEQNMRGKSALRMKLHAVVQI